MNQVQQNTERNVSFRSTLAPLVSQVCNRLGITQLLDFHCGNDPIMSMLRVDHKMRIQCYDPLVERFKASPLAAELVFYAPVNEPHEAIIDEAELLTGVVCIFALETEDCESWVPRLMEKFELQTYQRVDGGFYAILYCRPDVKLAVVNDGIAEGVKDGA